MAASVNYGPEAYMAHPNETAKWLPYYPNESWKREHMVQYYMCSGCGRAVGPRERTIRCPNCDRKMAHQIIWD